MTDGAIWLKIPIWLDAPPGVYSELDGVFKAKERMEKHFMNLLCAIDRFSLQFRRFKVASDVNNRRK